MRRATYKTFVKVIKEESKKAREVVRDEGEKTREVLKEKIEEDIE